MRFPFTLTRSMTAYLLRKKLAGEKIFPLVLMLEPLHASNLSGASGGRAREYADTLHRRLPVARCLAAVTECGVPIVSLCGGEPLLYPDIGVLVESLVARQKHVYLCTNGTLLAKMLPGFRPSSRLLVNVRLDGMEATHDRLAERAGVFAAAIRGILDAKVAGFTVSTETTIYQDTDLHEIAVLFDYLYELGVDGFMLSPAFAAASPEAHAEGATRFFATREEVHAKFRTRARSCGTSGLPPRLCTWSFSAASGSWIVPRGPIPPTTCKGGADPVTCSATPIMRPIRNWSIRPPGAISVRRATAAAPAAWGLAASSRPRCCRPPKVSATRCGWRCGR